MASKVPDLPIAIGAAVPQQVELQKLPPQISGPVGGYRGADYVIVGDQVVIVDPSAGWSPSYRIFVERLL